MNSVTVVMLALVGVLAGVGAGYVVKRGGYGRRWDVLLGLVGSLAGSWLFWALRSSPGAEPTVLVGVALIGAAIAIVGQRMLRPRPWIWSFLSRR